MNSFRMCKFQILYIGFLIALWFAAWASWAGITPVLPPECTEPVSGSDTSIAVGAMGHVGAL